MPLEHGQHAGRNPTYTLGGIPLTRWEESHLHAGRNPTYRSRSGTASALRTASSSRRRCAHTHARAPTHVAHIAHRNTRIRARAHAYAYAHAHTHLYTCTDMAYICIDISMCVRVCINIGSLYVHRFVGMGHRCAAIGRKAQADCLYACAWRWDVAASTPPASPLSAPCLHPSILRRASARARTDACARPQCVRTKADPRGSDRIGSRRHRRAV